MRRLRASVPNQQAIGAGYLNLYGPKLDLSDVDTSAPVMRRATSAWHQNPAHLAQANLRYPYLGLERSEGFLCGRNLEQAFLDELMIASVPERRRWEFGVIPVGVTVQNAIGDEGTIKTATGLVNSTPAPPAMASLGLDGGVITINLEEWPHG